MALLPAGFGLPPLPYLLVLVAGVVAVGYAVRQRGLTVGEREVLALAPWMVFGSALHVLYALDVVPPVVRPLLGTPAVYVAVAVVAGAAWLAFDAAGSAPQPLAALGVLAAAAAVVAVLGVGVARDTLAPAWPAVALVAGVVLATVGWVGLVRVAPDAAVTGWVGRLAVLGHAVDGVSTAVGVGVLGFDERTPLSRLIIEAGEALLGAGGPVFVVVKLLVAAGAVALFADYVREDPGEGYPLLGLVAAVGLGPGVHNLLLFTVA
jgi:uncharacterized membrane protein